MVKVDVVNAVYANIENRPGTLARATRTLSDIGINIEAVSVETHGSHAFLRVITPRAAEAVEALQRARIDAWVSEVCIASIPNRAGELSRVAAELAAASINIEGIVTTTDGRLAIRTSDIDSTATILRKL